MKYQDLDEDVKEKLRDELRYSDGYLSDDWWDGEYDWAREVGAMFGLRLDNIYFSGFSSQGDGASFTGKLYFKECNEEELPKDIKSIYNILKEPAALLTITNGETYAVSISTSGTYSHSNTMSFAFNYPELTEEDEDMLARYEDDISQALRDFADWIYKNLEQEYDYLMSDECVDEALISYECEYDEDGEEI